MKKKYYGKSKLGGVYKITNLKNGKIYIGAAKCFQKRQYQHASQLNKQRHANKHLQASWNKHGSDAFLFEVIEVVDGDKGRRFKVEQEYIDKLIEKGEWERTFNFKKKSVQKERTTFSTTPEETLKKRSRALKKAWAAKTPEERKAWGKAISKGTTGREVPLSKRKAQSKAMKKLHASPEGKAKYKKSNARAAKTRTGMKRTPEQRKRMSAAQKKCGNVPPGRKWTKKEREAQSKMMKEWAKGRVPWNRREVIQYTMDGVEVCRFESVTAAEKITGFKNIGMVARGERNHAGGYLWTYSDQLHI